MGMKWTQKFRKISFSYLFNHTFYIYNVIDNKFKIIKLDKKPQIRVISKDNEAVCLNNNCNYEYIDVNKYPRIRNITNDKNTINVLFDGKLPIDIEFIKIKIEEIFCFIKDISNKELFSCEFENLQTGKFVPVITSNYGNLKFENEHE